MTPPESRLGGDDGRAWRPRRAAIWLAGVIGLAVVAFAAAAIVPGSHVSRSTTGFGVARVTAAHRSTNPLGIRATKVFGSNIPASHYGTLVGAQENEGSTPQGQLTSDLSPLPPRAFDRPIAAYRAYAERWSDRLAAAVVTLRSALAANSRGASERAWDTAFGDYLHLGAVYGLLPTGLTRRLAAVPQTLGERRFLGLHRIEMGLWTGAAPRSLAPTASALAGAVAQERRVLPRVSISPLQYATRAHEILEDAQRDLLSGTQVPWSGAGVLGTAAGVAVTREVISTLVPLLQGRDNTLVEVQNWLYQLQHVMSGLRRPDGAWPANRQLSTLARERLDGTLAGTLGALALIPGTLETTEIPDIPAIPGTRSR